jgi:hypothetical protein
LNNESKRNFYYKLLIIFILILVALICGYALERKYAYCINIKCSLDVILINSLIVSSGPLLFLVLYPTDLIIAVIAVGLYFSILILIIIWLFFFKPKFTHFYWALIWLLMGFFIAYELAG